MAKQITKTIKKTATEKQATVIKKASIMSGKYFSAIHNEDDQYIEAPSKQEPVKKNSKLPAEEYITTMNGNRISIGNARKLYNSEQFMHYSEVYLVVTKVTDMEVTLSYATMNQIIEHSMIILQLSYLSRESQIQIINIHKKDEGTIGVALLNNDVAKSFDLVEDVRLGVYVSKKRSTSEQYCDYQKFKIPEFINAIKRSGNMNKMIEYGMHSPTFIKTEGKKYTFGIEIETSMGALPYHARNLNVQCVYDGSLKGEDGVAHGGEYVTGILKGDSGLIHLRNIVQEIAKRCVVNKQCSIHVHIGGVDFTQEFIVYMYKLGLALENELYAMMPRSRSTGEYCNRMLRFPININRKMASSYVTDIDIYYEKILKIIAVKEIKSVRSLSRKHDHPLGHCCGYDRKTPRYWWLNFVPAMFDIRHCESYSIEFRMHSATLNYSKIEYWILICMGIVNFVENHKDKITDTTTLAEVINSTYPRQASKILQYVEKRKKLFAVRSSTAEISDYNEQIEIKKMSKKQQIT